MKTKFMQKVPSKGKHCSDPGNQSIAVNIPPEKRKPLIIQYLHNPVLEKMLRENSFTISFPKKPYAVSSFHWDSYVQSIWSTILQFSLPKYYMFFTLFQPRYINFEYQSFLKMGLNFLNVLSFILSHNLFLWRNSWLLSTID